MDISIWMNAFDEALHEAFGERVWFVGLQGSRGRGEATDTSDIDVVVILDELTPPDIHTYRTMLDSLPHRELICGFLSGKEELLNWEPSDLFQFYYDTKPIRGSLEALLPLLDADSVDRAIRIGACNLYHGCLHNMLHERSEDVLRGLYKSACFTVQAIAFQETGAYVRRRDELLQVVSRDEQAILNTADALKKGGAVDLDPLTETLLLWAQKQLTDRTPPQKDTEI